jgi:hypothetical protein
MTKPKKPARKPAKRSSVNRSKGKKHTPRQIRLLEGLIDGKSTRRAALDAGYSEHMAERPQELLNSESFKSLRAEFADMLPTLEHLAQRVREGCDAQARKFFSHVVEENVAPKGKKKKLVKRMMIEHRDVVDFEQRRKYVETAIECKGLKPDPKIQIGDGQPIINVNIRYIGEKE